MPLLSTDTKKNTNVVRKKNTNVVTKTNTDVATKTNTDADTKKKTNAELDTKTGQCLPFKAHCPLWQTSLSLSLSLSYEGWTRRTLLNTSITNMKTQTQNTLDYKDHHDRHKEFFFMM